VAPDAFDFPAALLELAQITFWPDGIDFEAFDTFVSREETTEWFRAWTGNPAVDGDAFRIFGRDITGGYAAFWLAADGKPIAAQPIVFLGSEGELGVISSDLSDFLWLLAGDSGPAEVAFGLGTTCPRPDGVDEVVRRHAKGHQRSVAEITRAAQRAFPDFAAMIDDLIR
jgi:hypothetical protein